MFQIEPNRSLLARTRFSELKRSKTNCNPVVAGALTNKHSDLIVFQDAAHTFDYMLSGKSEKKSTKVRSRMEGAGNFFKIVTPQLDCYGFCV